MAGKMTTCSHCGAEIAASAKTCPKCGAKNKKPIYKKWWFYLIVVAVIVGIAGGGGNSDSKKQTASPTVKQTQSPGDDASAIVQEPVSNEADNSEVSQESNAEDADETAYTVYDVTELFDALNSNAMKAQDTYKGEYVELHGFLGTIDSSGKYFGLAADENNYEYMFQEVLCYIKTDEQKQVLMEKNKGDAIVVRGQITDVGEVLGYSLKIDSVE
ncbi:MAG: zinc ribbon domain-containing protein [Oscillospiraceae bacterium]|nr:zinc ribbon domain-containing protein [Oscillospiraceae bacterium]